MKVDIPVGSGCSDRFTTATAEVTLNELHAAPQWKALNALRSPDADVTFTGLLKRHGLP